MDWNKIDKSWNEFAESKGVKLQYAERNLFHTIECKYNVDFNADYGSSSFSGVLWKTHDGHNRNRTKISTLYNLERNLDDLHIKTSGIKRLFVKNELAENEKKIAEILKKLNGENLILKKNRLEIEFKGILSAKSDFDKVIELIKEVKTSS